MKICSRKTCNNILSKDKFNKSKKNKNNLDDICKQCKSKYYYKNKELGEK